MRLEKIKLAGFKSFVDPTTVPMPSNLVGIVGPNGCGKSNVIDAVRWVMGESSAKMLRGESMADVIFNGSNSRKPVGHASIELVFENSDGRAGGEYAQYNQISVKRQVSRDGQSHYYLNSARCRRRDITDLFLGTGLGPRSYAIIEQGMISRLIEARPEDLRVFLEEAAGISKYKERRRETENRISRTRENLDRLNDLRDEVAKQLRHLQRQAATAERYQRYKQDERLLQAQLMALRWQEIDTRIQTEERQIRELETGQEAAIANQRRLEAGIEQDREEHHEANERFNEVQGRVYAVGADIARLEQGIQYARDSLRQHQQDLEQAERAWGELDEHRRNDSEQLETLRLSLAEQEPALEEAREDEMLASERLAEAQAAMHAWQTEWDRFNQEAAEPAQSAQVERTRINHLEQQDNDLRQRLQRLEEEYERLGDHGLEAQLAELEAREAEQAGQGELLQEELDRLRAEIDATREANRALGGEIDEQRAGLQADRGRQASLEALQQAALGENQDAAAEAWLEQRHLRQAQRLAQRLRVTPRWQRAVEVVLGHQLQAVCVTGVDQLGGQLEGLESAALALFEEGDARISVEPDSLAAQVEAPNGAAALLHGVRVAEDLAAALADRAALAAGQSLITPEGIWIGSNWLRLPGEGDAAAGVLAREQELEQLAARIEERSARVEALVERQQAGREAQRGQEQAREEQQRRLNDSNRQLADLRASLSGKRTRAEHIQQRREHLRQEAEELRARMEDDREEMALARERLHSALERMETYASQRESLVHRRDGLREEVARLGEAAGERRNLAHEIALRVESMRSAEASLSQSLERVQGQLEQLAGRRELLREQIEEGAEPLEEQREALEELLQRRIQVEAELAEARKLLEVIDGRLRENEQRRHQAEQAVEVVRGRLEQARLKRQEMLIRAKTLEERLRETGLQREQLLAEMPAEAAEAEWENELERLQARIQRLGPIIDEFKEQSQRLEYLDAQHADVSESLETLENAIRKIDRETRARFKEVFDKVNDGLQAMFPRLFGGGHAYLEMTGEDLLDTGVTVMARPPGKRNSTIHLLSGGEKALTAVALVFSIFELNPAPFCMLDEVDAPLDDANVSRFCELVKSMAERVQFIFITHNKLTMEIAHQLTGVTMHEPGVSRLVSVDVDEAAQLAAM